MPTFKLTFEGYYRDQPPITETLTQWVSAESHARAVLSLYDDFMVLDLLDIEDVPEFNTAEYLREHRPSPCPRDRDDPPAPDMETPFSERIGEER